MVRLYRRLAAALAVANGMGAGIAVVPTPPSRPPETGVFLAEVETDAGEITRWAAGQPASAVPGPDWGLPAGDDVVVWSMACNGG